MSGMNVLREVMSAIPAIPGREFMMATLPGLNFNLPLNLTSIPSEAAGIIKLVLEAVIAVPLIAFAFAMKHAVLVGDAVYLKLHPFIVYAESLFPFTTAPEWVIPTVLALSLALYSLLQIVLPFYLNKNVSPRAEYMLYTLVIAPLAMAYVLDSIAAGIVVWTVIFLLSRINVGFNFDRKLPTVQICGLADMRDFRVYSFPEPGYDRVAGVNLGGFVMPVLIAFYLLHAVKGYVVPDHPLHGFFPVEFIPCFIALMLFTAVLIGSAKESFVGIVVDVAMVAAYLSFLFYVMKGMSAAPPASPAPTPIPTATQASMPELQMPGIEELRVWGPKFAFAIVALSVAGADLIKGILGEAVRKRLPTGIFGGGCERDAVLAAPIIGSAMILIFNSMDIIRTAPHSIAGWATIAVYVTAGVYFLIPITLGFALLTSLAIGLVTTPEGWLVLGGMFVTHIACTTLGGAALKLYVILIGLGLFLVLPAVCMYMTAGAFALMERERVEKALRSQEFRRLFSAFEAEKRKD